MFIATYNGRIIENWQIDSRNKSQSQYLAELIIEDHADDMPIAGKKKEMKAREKVSKQGAEPEPGPSTAPAATAPPQPVNSSEVPPPSGEGTSKQDQPKSPPLLPPPLVALCQKELFREDDRFFLVDGSAEGNVTRSFNHSCSPNLFAQPIFTETHDMRFHEAALFALRFVSFF